MNIPRTSTRVLDKVYILFSIAVGEIYSESSLEMGEKFMYIEERDQMCLVEAIATASESITLLKSFMESLDKFLKLHGLGEVKLDWGENPVLYEKVGYDFVLFTMNNGKDDVIYLNFYTGGTATGERVAGEPKAIDCSWNDALREILGCIGLLHHDALCENRVGRIIDMLDGNHQPKTSAFAEKLAQSL